MSVPTPDDGPGRAAAASGRPAPGTPSGEPGPAAAAADPSAHAAPSADGGPRTELYDLRVVVDRIEGRSVCGLQPGDYLEVTQSNRLTIPAGRHFCLYALASVLPLLPAKQRDLAPGDWLATDCEVACPDPEERLIMRIERTGRSSMATEDLT